MKHKLINSAIALAALTFLILNVSSGAPSAVPNMTMFVYDSNLQLKGTCTLNSSKLPQYYRNTFNGQFELDISTMSCTPDNIFGNGFN